MRASALALGLARRRVLAAVSGGPDSVALLLALRELAPALGISLAAATVDHRLREGSAADARYVAALCRRLGVPCYRLKVAVGREGGVEAAARRARYRALLALARREGHQAVVTAHTLEDQVETVLLRLSRGAGLRGARGILARRGMLVRPMLGVSRAQVKALLAERRVRPRRDPTNDSPAFARNRVRAEVLPALERALGPTAVPAIARFARAASADERLLAALARRAEAGLLEARGAAGEAGRLRRLPEALRRRVLQRAARRAGARLTASQLQALDAALGAAGPRAVTLAKGLEFRVAYGRFAFASAGAPPPRGFCHPIPAEGRHAFEEAVVEVARCTPRSRRQPGELRFDADRVAWPLVLRSRRPGDRFVPRGAGGKKLKALLIDAKIPRERRDLLPVLCDARGALLAVAGLRASQAAADGLRAPRQLRVRLVAGPSAGDGPRVTERVAPPRSRVGAPARMKGAVPGRAK